MLPITLRLNSMTPAPDQGGHVAEWRQALAAAAEAIAIPEAVQNTLTSKFFFVRIEVFFTKENLLMSDLDNLAKPILDTLFFNAHANPPIGALFPHIDDKRVFALALTKHRVATSAEEGVTIHIHWCDGE